MSSKLYASFFRVENSLLSNRGRSNFWTRGNPKEREGKKKLRFGYVKPMDSAIHDAMSRDVGACHNTIQYVECSIRAFVGLKYPDISLSNNE